MKSLPKFVLAAALSLAAPAALVIAAAPAYAQSVRPAVGKPLQAASQMLSRGNAAGALAKAREAEAVGGKTAYETAVVQQLLSSIYTQQRNFGAAATAAQAALATNALPPNAAGAIRGSLPQLYYAAGNYARAIELGKGSSNPRIQTVVLQAEYQRRNFKGAAEQAEKMVKAAQAGGGRPSESVLQVLADSRRQLGDRAGSERALEQLLTFYPTPQVWASTLYSYQQSARFTDPELFEFLRLSRQVGALRGNGFVQMAQLGMVLGMPNESRKVLAEAQAAGSLNLAGPDGSRLQRLINNSATQAAAAQANMGKLAAAANADRTGNGDLALARAQMSFDMYPQAVASLRRALQKGGLKDPDLATINLGVALVGAQQKPEAQKTFRSVKPQSRYSAIANFWALATRG